MDNLRFHTPYKHTQISSSPNPKYHTPLTSVGLLAALAAPVPLAPPGVGVARQRLEEGGRHLGSPLGCRSGVGVVAAVGASGQGLQPPPVGIITPWVGLYFTIPREPTHHNSMISPPLVHNHIHNQLAIHARHITL